MAIIRRRGFVENPFDFFKMLIPTLLIVFIGAVLIIIYKGPPNGPNSFFKTVGGSIIFILLLEIGFLLIVAVTLSFSKKRTVICDSEGCRISGVDLWGNMEPNEYFRWHEVTDTNLRLLRTGRGGAHVNLTATVNNNETRLLSGDWLNRRDFDALLETFDQATPHLSYICAKTEKAGRLLIIEEKQGYCKAERR